MSTIYILWLRQLKRYFRSKSRIVGSIGQPLLFLVGLGFGFSHIYSQAGGGNYIEFLVPGIVAMSVLFSAIFAGMEVIWDRQFGFLKETLVAPVSRVSIMIGRTLGGATVAMLQGCIVFVISLLIGFHPVSGFIFPGIFFMFLIAVLFTALGTALASQIEDMQAFPLIMNFIVMPIFFLSGAIFPLSGLPKAIDAFASLNPLTYGVDGLRSALTGIASYPLGHDIFILSITTLVLVAIGGYLFEKIQI